MVLLRVFLVLVFSIWGAIAKDPEVCSDLCQSKDLGFFYNYSRACFCDEECKLHGDCCADAKTSTVFNQNEGDKYECNVKLPNHEYIYTISKCPPSYNQESLTKELCESAFNASQQDANKLVTRLPVYSSSTKKAYKNIYCAKCNIANFNLRDVSLFKLKQDDVSDLDEQEKAKDEVSANLETLLAEETNGTNIIFEPPDDADLRRCLPLIYNCPENYTNQEIIRNCSSHTAIRIYQWDKPMSFYKNEYCAKCNGRERQNLVCRFRPPQNAIKGLGTGHNLQILFDLSDFYGDIVINLKIKVHGNQDYEITKNCTQNANNSASTDPLDKIVCSKTIGISINQLKSKNKRGNCTAQNQETSDNATNDMIKGYMTLIGQSISIICLALLLILYVSYKVLRNLPGKILISLCLSLMISQLIFLLTPYLASDTIYETMQLAHNTSNASKTSVETTNVKCIENAFTRISEMVAYFSHSCFVLGVLNHYFNLSFFVWTNVMAYDVYKMLSILASSKKGDKKQHASDMDSESGRQFLKYSLYGWMLPLVIVSATVLSQFLFKYLAYGFNICYISRQKDLFFAFVLPVILMILANLYFLAVSIRSVRAVDSMSKRYLRKPSENSNFTTSSTANQLDYPDKITSLNDSKVKFSKANQKERNKNLKNLNNQSNCSQKKRLILFLKLFIVAGITWTLGIISSFSKDSFIWYIYVLVNSLQGLFIFLSFAFNDKTKQVLKRSECFQRFISFITCGRTSFAAKFFASSTMSTQNDTLTSSTR